MEGKQVREAVFIPPQALQRVRNENEQLRIELRDLSKRLDEMLSSHPKKPQDPASIRSKELAIARSHLDHHEKQLKDLLRAQSLLSPTRVADLQAEVEELKARIREKEVGNKGLRRLEKERGGELNTLTEDSGAMAELKAAVDHTRRFQKAVSDLEKELIRGEETHKTVSNRVIELEAKYKEEMGRNAGHGEDEEPKPLPVGEQDLETIKKKVQALEKKRNADTAAYRHTLQSAESQLALLHKQLADAQTCCKDKERQSRVAVLAVKEVSYGLKVTQKKNESLSAAVKVTPKSSEEEEQSTAFVTSPMA